MTPKNSLKFAKSSENRIIERMRHTSMTVMYKGHKTAKVLKTSVNTIVMFEYKTCFFDTWQAAVKFLLVNGYNF